MQRKLLGFIAAAMCVLVSFVTLEKQAAARVMAPDFVELAKKLKPAVVNISTTKVVAQQQRRSQQSPFGNDPFNDFFDRFFQDVPQRPYKQRGQGSGFVISDEGYIFTNNHVVAGADEITVKLSDGREFKGKVKGADEKLDLALIKIDTKEHLPVAPLGDSDAIEVGEWVMAIGNPFGLAQTVTAGIVSAKGRWIGSGPYDDFIQTDASINPGNSGGPLFNVNGEVIGINSAIIQGGQGIGFAIPVNMAKAVLTQLKETGKVTRGWLGVVVQPVTPELAQSFGLKEEKGALISEVLKESPAEKGGIEVGDILMEFDGKKISEMNELPRIAATAPVGKKAKVKLLRKGKIIEKTVVIEKMADTGAETSKQPAEVKEKLGLTVSDLTKEIAAQIGTKETSGVVVTSVKPGSEAEDKGVMLGDIIKEINYTAIRNTADYEKVVTSVKKGSFVRLLVRRGAGSVFVALKVE
jgi:serine protease Do